MVVTYLTTDVGHGQNNSLLLLGLRQSRRRPSDNDRVDSVGTHGEDEAGAVSSSGIESRSSENETDNGNGQTSCDVPGTLVHASRIPTEQNSRGTSEDEWWAGHDQGDGSIESKSLDDTGNS